jgi:alkyl sulfatase BDS1-like metallo-beta-lactamase superfamily hydrolase
VSASGSASGAGAGGFAARLDCPAAIHPDLAAHSRLFERKIHRVGDRVYCAVGYNLANIITVVGPEGMVVIDTGMDTAQAEAVLADLRRLSDAPVAAIVYTHHHTDHVQGTSALVDPDELASGRVPIYAHSSLLAEYQQETGLIGPIMGARAMAMYAMVLDGADMEQMNAGIGPAFTPGPNGFVAPTHVFDDHLEVTAGGVRLQMHHVPSEAASEICVVLPDDGVLCSAEVIQDHGFPNLYTLRGAKFRDPKAWYESIDVMAKLSAGCEQMVLQHGPPVTDRAEMRAVLRDYRDAIQYTLDQTIRWANRGLAKDEIARLVKLPPHLADRRPWLQPFYGSVAHSVPAIYSGYIGWFDGDPVTLDPTPRAEQAAKLVEAMGGRAAVLERAAGALESGDARFAAELATYLIRLAPNDMDARQVKAAAYRILGYATVNATWRGFYLTGARVLDGSLDPAPIYQMGVQMTVTDELLGLLPARMLVESAPPRLKAEEVLEVEMSTGWCFTDVDEGYTLTIRRGVAVVEAVAVESLADGSVPAVAVVTGPRVALGAALAGAVPVADALTRRDLRVAGSADALARFLGAFEQIGTDWPNFYLR